MNQQSHPPLKNLLKREYSYFKDVEKFLQGPSYWRLNDIPKGRPDKIAHKPTKRKKRKVLVKPPFRWSDNETESEHEKNWTYKPLNTALWDPELNILPQYRKNASREIKPNFFDHYEFAPNLMTWGKNAGRPRRKRPRRSDRMLDSSDTSDYSSGEEEPSVSTNFVEKLYMYLLIQFEIVNSNVLTD